MNDVLEVQVEEIKNDALVNLVNASGLDKTKSEFILQKFQDYFKIAAHWEKQSKAIVITSDNQKAEMKMAREGRLFLREKRIEIERSRKELKEQSLREGKAIDGIANVLKGLIEPIEDYLDRQERFTEIREEAAKEERRMGREGELQSLGVDTSVYNLKEMTEEGYQALLSGTKLAIKQKAESEKRAEEERIAQAKEQERIKAENERMKKEAEVKEKELAKERMKAEAEKKALEEKALKAKKEAEERERKLKAEQDAILKKERDEREKLEAQLKAKAEAEKKEKERIAKEEAASKRAPDKAKLLALVTKINAIEFPDVKSKEAQEILNNAKELLRKTSEYINQKAAAL